MAKKFIQKLRSGNFFHVGFLIVGLMLVFSLYLLKVKEFNANQEITTEETFDHYKIGDVNLNMASAEISLPSHKAYLTYELVNNALFRSFTEATGYLTTRERQNTLPNWRFPEHTSNSPLISDSEYWTASPSEPVMWLTREDAEAFCIWLSDRRGSLSPYVTNSNLKIWERKGLRLPSTEELEIFEDLPTTTVWEWTANDFSDFSSNGSKQYLTAWKKNNPLYHRRNQDVISDNEIAIGFRLAWTQ